MLGRKRSRLAVLSILVLFVALLIGTGISLVRSPHEIALAGADPLAQSPTVLESTDPISSQLFSAYRASLQMDNGAAPGVLAIPTASGVSCSAPLVLSGSIITGTSPVYAGRLIRNGVPSVCGEDYSCSGIQSTGSKFSYQKFQLINPSSDWQCVSVDIDARSCAQQVYSAAYLNSFSPANLCGNIQGAMGFSTSGVYGYSLMVPPGTNFSIVNNTTGITPPASDCAGYTMTVSLCSASPEVMVDRGEQPLTLNANSLGQAVTNIPVFFTNTGNFTASLDARTVSETVDISVLDNKPAVVQANFGHAGAIVPPGNTISTTIALEFTGSQYTCLPRLYQISQQVTMTLNTYYCNGYNPPSSQVLTGSLLPADNFDEDGWAFQAAPGDQISVTVDTVSAATAFDPEGCISGTPNGPCLAGFQDDDSFSCTFPPPSFACPRFGGLLPADPDGDNIYYIRINSGSGSSGFAGPVGEYRASLLITSGPTGACPVVQALDNGFNSFINAAGLDFSQSETVAPPTSTIVVKTYPIQVFVPPSNPSDPSCGIQYLPMLLR